MYTSTLLFFGIASLLQPGLARPIDSTTKAYANFGTTSLLVPLRFTVGRRDSNLVDTPLSPADIGKAVSFTVSGHDSNLVDTPPSLAGGSTFVSIHEVGVTMANTESDNDIDLVTRDSLIDTDNTSNNSADIAARGLANVGTSVGLIVSERLRSRSLET
ncbi:hypothetical protein ACMFMG_008750 [Clarireedia jacksonii]